MRRRRLKVRLPKMFVGINGGIADLHAAATHLDRMDGAMLGRAAYQNPATLLGVDRMFGAASNIDSVAAAERMISYAERHCASGGRIASVTRHMIGLFQGRPGARRWRQILTVEAARPGAGPEIIRNALAAVSPERLAQAA